MNKAFYSKFKISKVRVPISGMGQAVLGQVWKAGMVAGVAAAAAATD